MSTTPTPKPDKLRIPATVLLPVAVVMVVSAFVLFQKLERSQPGQLQDQQTQAQVAVAPAPEVVAKKLTLQQDSAAGTSPHTASVEASAPAPAPAPAQCWEGKFTLQAARLNKAQKETLGERAQKIQLGALLEKLSVQKIQPAQLCVRVGGNAVPFEKDSKDPATILVTGGTGRINTQASLQVSYCLKSQNCAPCKVKKDAFEDALLGESEADAQANADEDITAKLSPEVRRELARLENASKPAAIDAWELQSATTRCGRG